MRRTFVKEGGSVKSYLDLYPALKQRLGYTLLVQDYHELFPDHDLKIFAEWPSFSTKVLNIAKQSTDKTVITMLKELEEDSLNEGISRMFMVTIILKFMKFIFLDGITNRVLFLLPYLMKPVTIKKNSAGYWKPSKIEVAEGFIIHVKVSTKSKHWMLVLRNDLKCVLVKDC